MNNNAQHGSFSNVTDNQIFFGGRGQSLAMLILSRAHDVSVM